MTPEERAVVLWCEFAGPGDIEHLTGIGTEALREILVRSKMIPAPTIDVGHMDAIADALEAGTPVPAEARAWLFSRPWRRR